MSGNRLNCKHGALIIARCLECEREIAEEQRQLEPTPTATKEGERYECFEHPIEGVVAISRRGKGYSIAECRNMGNAKMIADALNLPIANDKQSQWVSVEDELPEGSDDCLCKCNSRSKRVIIALYSKAAGDWYDQHSNLRDITHWMPLPSPPEKK